MNIEEFKDEDFEDTDIEVDLDVITPRVPPIHSKDCKNSFQKLSGKQSQTYSTNKFIKRSNFDSPI